jgi:hypothetical protein
MLGLFPYMKYQPWYALSELVDNAIQSSISNHDTLRMANPKYGLFVDIEIDPSDGGSIIVRDNAAGIGPTDWLRAFRVADPPADASGLSQFGVGMKAACCWFARKWSVRTTALGSDVVRSVTFDVPQIIALNAETLNVIEEPISPLEHFTVIEMHDLHRPIAGRTLGKTRNYLGGIYRQFLRDRQLMLTVKGEPVKYEDPEVLVAPRYNDRSGESHIWRQDVRIELESGRGIRGFVGIRETGDARQGGLALLYRNKVVTGSGEEAYKPSAIFKGGNSFESQRIFGELHMDDFDVTYTKDALVWYDEEDEFVEALVAALDSEPWPLIRQAREFRKRTPEASPPGWASSVLDSIHAAFESAVRDKQYEVQTPGGRDDESASAFLPEPTGEDSEEDTRGEEVTCRTINVPYQGSAWEAELQLISDPAVLKWLTVDKVDERRLRLNVNRAHPFMRAWCELPGQELEPVWRVAVALGLAQEMARLAGAKLPGRVTEIVNDLLRNVLAHKS